MNLKHLREFFHRKPEEEPEGYTDEDEELNAMLVEDFGEETDGEEDNEAFFW